MNHSEPSFNDPAGEENAAAYRRRSAQHRKTQRELAIILDGRGWDHARIEELLEIDAATLRRMLASDGHKVCTDCVYDRHGHCIGLVVDVSGEIDRCECPRCRASEIRAA